MSDNSGLLKYMIAATGLVINIMTICFIYDAYTEYRDLGAIREITIQMLVPFIIGLRCFFGLWIHAFHMEV